MRTLCFGEMLLRLSPADHLRIEQASAFDARRNASAPVPG